LLAPSREHALSSPYLEPFKGTDIPVLFSFVHIDEMVFRNVGEFKGCKFTNIESQ
jgi:HSP90 family molecular chaperone